MTDGELDPSFRALSGHLKFTVRRHEFNKDSLLDGLVPKGDVAPLISKDARAQRRERLALD